MDEVIEVAFLPLLVKAGKCIKGLFTMEVLNQTCHHIHYCRTAAMLHKGTHATIIKVCILRPLLLLWDTYSIWSHGKQRSLEKSSILVMWVYLEETILQPFELSKEWSSFYLETQVLWQYCILGMYEKVLGCISSLLGTFLPHEIHPSSTRLFNLVCKLLFLFNKFLPLCFSLLLQQLLLLYERNRSRHIMEYLMCM